MINFKKKHIALGLAIVSLTACIKTKSKHGIAGPDYIDKSIVEEQINKGMSIEDLNRALSDGNIIKTNNDTKISATEDNGVVVFNYKGNYGIIEFRSDNFENKNGVLTSSKSGETKTYYGYCIKDTTNCYDGTDEQSAKESFASNEYKKSWDVLSDEEKDPFYTWWNSAKNNPVTQKDHMSYSLKLFGSTLDNALSYSNFGVIIEYKKQRGDVYNADEQSINYFGYGDVSKKQDLANNTSFTGKAFATANYNNKDENVKLYKDLEGTASLNVNGSGDKNLEIALKDYYTLKFNDLVLSDVSGNNKLGDSRFNFIEGSEGGDAGYQGYGDGSASEVVGGFATHWMNNNESVYINGSFGATKNP